MADVEGNTAMWDAIAAKHHSIFRILFHWASISDPCTAGDLLTTAARRNDVAVMKELLKHGLFVDSKDRHGSTPIQIAMEENHSEMVELLVMNGADVNTEDVHKSNNKFLSSLNLDEMLHKREVGHQISMLDSVVDNVIVKKSEDKVPLEEFKKEKSLKGSACSIRVSIYRGHPVKRRENCCTEAGRLITLPVSLEELKSTAGTWLYVDKIV